MFYVLTVIASFVLGMVVRTLFCAEAPDNGEKLYTFRDLTKAWNDGYDTHERRLLGEKRLAGYGA